MADDELPNFDIISSLGLQAPESEAKNSGKKNEVANNKRRFAQMDEEELNDVVNDYFFFFLTIFSLHLLTL